jgi:signal transduction histidine kinase
VRFSALIQASGAEILKSYEEKLKASYGPVAADPGCLGQLIANGADILADAAESVRAGAVQVGDRHNVLAWKIGEIQARCQLSPADALAATMAFFDVAVNSLARHVGDDPDLAPHLVIAVLALNKSLNTRISESITAYTSYLLNRIQEAHVDERRRIARELHDRLGEGLSVALRHLELYEIVCGGHPGGAPQASLPKQAVVEAMRSLRAVTCDLRQEPVMSLEKALDQYVDSRAAEADVQLRVSGDETWAPATVIDEVYLIVREAIRNALAHAAPRLVVITISLTPHQLRARVEDDGRGFMTGEHVAGTAGLVSMRERTVLIGGRLTISSAPGEGTRVELLVPLPGHRDG